MQVLHGLHGAILQKVATFIATAVRTSNRSFGEVLAYFYHFIDAEY
jgi:hypothetical protein